MHAARNGDGGRPLAREQQCIRVGRLNLGSGGTSRSFFRSSAGWIRIFYLKLPFFILLCLAVFAHSATAKPVIADPPFSTPNVGGIWHAPALPSGATRAGFIQSDFLRFNLLIFTPHDGFVELLRNA